MKKISAFFSFSRRERYGNTILICLFLFCCYFPELLPRFFPPPPVPEFRQQFVHLIETDTHSVPLSKDTLFDFDPNKAGLEVFMQLGLSRRTAQTILNYREKGGKFFKKEDFARIYSISDAEFERLAPYIRIAATKPEKSPPEWKTERKKETVIVDVNQAKEEEWTQLRGIGPGYAGRIVRFREKLGGFASIDQIGETYGFPDSVFQKIKPQLVHSPVYRQLPVNKATEEELALHPYLQKRQARVLTMYRQNHGLFRSIEDLKQIRAIPDSTLQKLIPYISFEE